MTLYSFTKDATTTTTDSTPDGDDKATLLPNTDSPIDETKTTTKGSVKIIVTLPNAGFGVATINMAVVAGSVVGGIAVAALLIVAPIAILLVVLFWWRRGRKDEVDAMSETRCVERHHNCLYVEMDVWITYVHTREILLWCTEKFGLQMKQQPLYSGPVCMCTGSKMAIESLT